MVSATTTRHLSILGVDGTLAGLWAGWEALEGSSILGHRVGDCSSVKEDSSLVDVGNGVTLAMVVLVIGNASLTTEQLNLLGGLDNLGTSEKTSSGDVALDECRVVGSAGEGSGLVWETLVVKELLEQVLDFSRASGTSHVVGRTVTVVDLVGEVGRADHVEVEVQLDLVQLTVIKAVDVEGASKETEFLSGPPGKANGVVELEVSKGFGNGHDTNGAGAVVVDTGAGIDGVGVSTKHDNIVVVSSLGLSNDVPAVRYRISIYTPED